MGGVPDKILTWQMVQPTVKNRETGEIKDVKSFYDLIIEAGQGALKDAGIDAKDIDGVWMADEICWRLGLHPAIPTASLDPASLRKEIRFVCLGALKHVADKNSSASAFQPSRRWHAPLMRCSKRSSPPDSSQKSVNRHTTSS